jgi:hypothetical protein
MARGTPTYFSGTITGTNNVQDLYSQFETRIKAYQSNSTDAWAEWDVISATAGSRDKVYRTLGDRTLASGAGDAVGIIRLQEGANYIDFSAFQDFSNSAGSGTNEAGSTSFSTGRWASLSATQDIDYFGISNEYEFTMISVQGGSYRWVSFGIPRRTHIMSSRNGVAFTSNAETAGSSVVIEVDRDITANIEVGQQIWAYNITPTATALRSGAINIGNVTAKASGSITIDTLANNLDAGAIIGLDPSPMYIGTGTTAIAGSYFTNWLDGTYTSTTGQLAELEVPIELATEGNVDPSVLGYYKGSESFFDLTDATKGGVRGCPEFMVFWATGTQADADRMIPDDDTNDAYKIFPSIKYASVWSMSIGPGATA